MTPDNQPERITDEELVMNVINEWNINWINQDIALITVAKECLKRQKEQHAETLKALFEDFRKECELFEEVNEQVPAGIVELDWQLILSKLEKKYLGLAEQGQVRESADLQNLGGQRE